MVNAGVSIANTAMAQPNFYQQPGDRLAAEQSRLKDLHAQLASAYERWEELESG
jgi:hypothetical protein